MQDFTTKISNFGTQVQHLFFPPEISESTPINMDEAIALLDTQRIARIAKAAFFLLSSITTTVSMVLTQAAIITWPLAIPMIAVSLVAGLIFYRMNSLDETYVERLNDETRQNLAKSEMENLFLKKKPIELNHIDQSLKNINRLLQCNVFSEYDIQKILRLHKQALEVNSDKPLGEFAFKEQGNAIVISARYEWSTQGRYGLNSYDMAVQATWDGTSEGPISVTYQTKQPQEQANAEAALD